VAGVVSSYTLLSSVDRLNAGVLGLKVPTYDPIVHYEQIRDSWGGTRIPTAGNPGAAPTT
jgi:outer membrane protein